MALQTQLWRRGYPDPLQITFHSRKNDGVEAVSCTESADLCAVVHACARGTRHARCSCRICWMRGVMLASRKRFAMYPKDCANEDASALRQAKSSYLIGYCLAMTIKCRGSSRHGAASVLDIAAVSYDRHDLTMLYNPRARYVTLTAKPLAMSLPAAAPVSELRERQRPVWL